MVTGETKLRQMEEEMNRFEAEIAHQVTVSIPPVAPTLPTAHIIPATPAIPAAPAIPAPAIPTAPVIPTAPAVPTAPVVPAAPMVGGFSYPPAATAFVPHQLRVAHSMSVPSAVPMYVPMVQPPVSAYPSSILPAAMPPTVHMPLPPKTTASLTGHTNNSFSKSSATNKQTDNRAPAAPTVITAPPQMAGPNELAARAKEAAAAAVAAKLKSENDDDDDDVTRALLAAAAGVTYTRVQGPNGREEVRASITKPPLTPVSSQSTVDQGASKSDSQQATAAPLPQPTLVYRSTSTSTIQQQQMQPLYQQQLQQQQQQEQQQSGKKKKRFIRVAAGVTWEDPTLADWDPHDFRIFCGDLGNEVSDDTLTRAFNRYASFQKARVVRDKRTGRSRGYGFVSFSDPADFTRAMREMNGKYVGNRPIKLKRSDWRTRQLETVRKKEKEKKKLGLKN